jgi:hypothetical protein
MMMLMHNPSFCFMQLLCWIALIKVQYSIVLTFFIKYHYLFIYFNLALYNCWFFLLIMVHNWIWVSSLSGLNGNNKENNIFMACTVIFKTKICYIVCTSLWLNNCASMIIILTWEQHTNDTSFFHRQTNLHNLIRVIVANFRIQVIEQPKDTGSSKKLRKNLAYTE